MTTKVSIVIALMNEAENIQPLLNSIYQSMEGIDYEVIMVDDGSTDQTVLKIAEFAKPQVKVIEFMKNFGQSTAMQAGIDAAKG